MSALVFSSHSRLMLVAPHPDDEALACSVILQRAVGAGAAIRVLYATDGGNNPWPQRVLERKWRLNADDRQHWGKLRRTEALAALQVLGVHESDVRFLGLPDQGLTRLLTTGSGPTVERIATSISSWAPTHLLVPSTHDTHPDHNALAVMLRLVLSTLYPRAPAMSVSAYSVHGHSKAFFDRAPEIQESNTERRIKELAIRCHKTQLKLSRRRFLTYATRSERFLPLGLHESAVADGPIRCVSLQSETLRVKLALSPKLRRGTDPTLFILGHDMMERVRCARIGIPAVSSTVKALECDTRECLFVARYKGNALKGEFNIPLNSFCADHALFVKLERRSWFFDEAGWLEVSPVIPDAADARTTPTRCITAEVLS